MAKKDSQPVAVLELPDTDKGVDLDTGVVASDPVTVSNTASNEESPYGEVDAHVNGAGEILEQAQRVNANPSQFSLSRNQDTDTKKETSQEVEEIYRREVQTERARSHQPESTASNALQMLDGIKTLTGALKVAGAFDTLRSNLTGLSERLDSLAENSGTLFGFIFKAAKWMVDGACSACAKIAETIREYVRRAIESRTTQEHKDTHTEQPSITQTETEEQKASEKPYENEVDDKPGIDRLREKLRKDREKLLAAALAEMAERLEEEEAKEDAEKDAYWDAREAREDQVDIIEALHPELDDNGLLRAYEHEGNFPQHLSLEELRFRAEKAKEEKASD